MQEIKTSHGVKYQQEQNDVAESSPGIRNR